MASRITDGIMHERVPASELCPGDLITADPYAAASDAQHAYRVLCGPRRGWITVQPVTRDLGRTDRRGPDSWYETGPERAARPPRNGVFVFPEETPHTR